MKLTILYNPYTKHEVTLFDIRKALVDAFPELRVSSYLTDGKDKYITLEDRITPEEMQKRIDNKM